MSQKYLLSIFFIFFCAFCTRASIVCPPDKTINCTDDIHDFYLLGRASAHGYGGHYVKYIDYKSQENCSVKKIDRFWFVDTNQDSKYQESEVSCIQKITVSKLTGGIEIFFPKDTTYTCTEKIANDKPTWVVGPCTVLGFTISDSKFEVNSPNCYKIARRFTVINWCDLGGGGGSWSHTQYISIKDNVPPKVLDCENKIIGLDETCSATFTIENSAEDIGVCASNLLYWTVEIDLWSNGTTDYTYGFTQTGQYYLLPTKNNEKISITLPTKIQKGKHKIKWTVKDQCGNFGGCSTTIETKDQKPPTPYLHDILTASFDGKNNMGLAVKASIFDVGSFDNCSAKNKLKFSFSEDISDTLRIINCDNSGFQFFTIYVTDEGGNQEFVDVFMLAFDNGSCLSGRQFAGKIHELNGNPVNDAEFTLMRNNTPVYSSFSNPKGEFAYQNIPLYQDYVIKAKNKRVEDNRVDIADLKMLQDHILGLRLLNEVERIAGDIDFDQQIRVKDLELMRDRVLGHVDALPRWTYSYSGSTLVNHVSLVENIDTFALAKLTRPLTIKTVYKGDITDAVEFKNQTRDILEVIETREFNMTSYYVSNAQTAQGVQIDIFATGDILEINSPYFEIKDGLNWKRVGPNHYRLVVLEDLFFDPQNPIFSIGNASVKEISGKLLFANYETKGIKVSQKIDDENSFKPYPNPGIGIYHFKSDKVKIQQVLDVSGKPIQHVQNQNQLQIHSIPGVYFVMYTMNGIQRREKLIIVN